MKDGGPTFPTYVGEDVEADNGITKRDLFALVAMHAILTSASSVAMADDPMTHLDKITWGQHVSQRSYGWADYMLAEREKQGA